MKKTTAVLVGAGLLALTGCTTSAPLPTAVGLGEETSPQTEVDLSAADVLDLVWEPRYARDICPLYRLNPSLVKAQAYATDSIAEAGEAWGLSSKEIVEALMDRLEEEC